MTLTSHADTGSHPPEISSLGLEVSDLAKAFGATRALKDCSLDVRLGEVHAVIGENGSGKSTLVKILTGVHLPDQGTIRVHGQSITGLRSPRAALELGVVAVLQETLVAGSRSVLENVWLGVDDLFRVKVPRTTKSRRAAEILAELLESPPDLDRPVEELSISDRQACCIARALVRDPKVLILDEATSALDVTTCDALFRIVARLAASGVSVLFISHRMDEIDKVADRITVLRSGESVATVGRGEASNAELVRLMTGRDRLVGSRRSWASGEHDAPAALTASEVRLRDGAAPFSFELRPGEIVGVAGLEGQGQDAFLQVLRGARPGAGSLTVGGSEVRSVRDAARSGIVYVPRERRAEALFETQSIRENFALPTLADDSRGGLIQRSSTERRFAEYVELLRIRLGRSGDSITTLSGGNQQKVVMARWLAAKPSVLVLNDPTRGVDLGAKRDFYDLLVELATQSVAVVMLSTELDEHVELMDRVLVFRDGGTFRELRGQEITREALVASFFGQELDVA
jgi:ABC-type sugar transport system ATPase subunit